MKKYSLILTVFIFTNLITLSIFAASNTGADAANGLWLSKDVKRGSSIIDIYGNAGKYFGKVIWISNPVTKDGEYQLDVNNPNPQDRHKPIIGSVIAKNFTFKDGKWEGGTIYDPDNGSVYKAKMWLSDDGSKLNLRGFIGISLLGKTEVWIKLK